MADRAPRFLPYLRRHKLRVAVVGISLVAAALVAGIAFSPLGSRFHRLLARSAGRIVDKVMDNLTLVAVASVVCVVGAWLFIAAKCFLEWRQERRE